MPSANLFWQRWIERAELDAIRCARIARIPQRVWADTPAVWVEPGPAADWLIADGRAARDADGALVDVARPARDCAPGVIPTAAAEAYAYELQRHLHKHVVAAEIRGLARFPEPELIEAVA